MAADTDPPPPIVGRAINTEAHVIAGDEAWPDWSAKRLTFAVLSVAVAYWAGARLGFALTSTSTPVATLWPPNAVLLAALLLAPKRVWWIILLGALPSHLIVELNGGVPLSMVLCWFVSNCSEALIGAWLVRRLLPTPVQLDSVHAFGVFLFGASFLATFLSSFLDAAFVSWNGWGQSSYWMVWRIRSLSNLLATQTLVPVALALGPETLAAVRAAPLQRRAEGLSLAIALLLVCLVAFLMPLGFGHVGPALLYAPLPFLIWAAIRFGVAGISLCLATVTVLAIWGTIRGGGPFTGLAPPETAFSLQLFLFLIGIPLSLLATVIQERRRAEIKMMENERLLALTIKSAHIGIWTVDLDTGKVSADEVLTDMIGQPNTEGDVLAGVTVRDHSGPRWTTADHIRTEDGGEAVIAERELEVRHTDGTVRWILSRGMMLHRPDGTPFGATGTAIDISDRKREEQAIREHDERMALAAAAIDIGFWSLELGSGETWLSDHCYAMLGLSLNTDPIAALEMLSGQPSVSHMVAAVDNAFPRSATLLGEIRIQRPDGTERWLASSARLEWNAAGKPMRMMGVSRDITDQKEAEREADERRHELAHLARVATIGELSPTIVHELGQPIGAIALNVHTAQRLVDREVVDRAELRYIVDDITRDAQRAGEVITRLRGLLRRNELAREPLDMRTVVRESLDLARSVLSKDRIKVALVVPPDQLTVMANRPQLQQVLLNLILNARDAMMATPQDDRHLRVTVAMGSNAMVSVRIADSGSGIARENLKQVFEPFFTLKSQGLGLGLAISRSIMRDHGGDLYAEDIEVGAVLRLTLPRLGLYQPGGALSHDVPAPRQAVPRADL